MRRRFANDSIKHRFSVNLTSDQKCSLDSIQDMLERKYNRSQIPSVSLLFSFTLLKFAEEVASDPTALDQAMREMVAHGYSPSPKLMKREPV